jgi:16S rRNA processing protein RimM
MRQVLQRLKSGAMADVTKRILLGDIVAAHGIRGEVVLRVYTNDPEDIGAYGPLSDESGKHSFEIASAKATAKGVHVRLKGVTTRNEAEALRGTKLYVARDALPPPDEGDYYHEDLVGLTAITPEGTTLGRVVAVQNFGAGDLIEIQLTGGKLTEFVPFTDTYVPTVDIAGGRLTIIVPVMVGDPEPTEGDTQ